MLSFFLSVVSRDLLAHGRQPGDILNPLVFFVIVISLFPLGVGPGKQLLQTIAPGVIWVAALLAALMSLDNIFRSDYEDGSLEQMALSPRPLVLIVIGKVCAHWVVAGLPLLLLTPLAAMMYYLDGQAIRAMSLSALLTTPVLSLVGSTGAALTLGLPRGGLLVATLVLPLYVPALVFATSIVLSANEGQPYAGQIYWLIALLLLALGVSPIASAAALRVSLGR